MTDRRELVVVIGVADDTFADPAELGRQLGMPAGCVVTHAKWNDAQVPGRLDREVQAIQQCVDILGPLDPSQASGVAEYVAGRYVRGR